MSDGTRRFIAVVIMVVGGAFLWFAGRSSGDAEAARNEVHATVASASEQALCSDPRLKGAYSFARGGWVYVHLEGDPGRDRFPARISAGKRN